jgi:hypothetical protein
VDWQKAGQAFQGGANVLAGGLMDKYQRKRDMEDWEQKQRIASTIQTGEREQEHAFQFGKQTREFTLEGIKNDLKTNPELIPYAIRAEQGDEEATRILSIYAGAKYQMDRRTPLSSDELALLKDLPPQTRHVIINRHLTTLNEESKRQADLEGVKVRTERDRTMAKKAEMDLAEGSAAGRSEVNKTRTDTTKLITDRTEAREKKMAAIQQLDTNILTLQGYVGDKVREKATAKKGAGQGIDLEIATIQEKITQAEKQKKRWEDDIQREADVMKKRRPDMFPEEAPAKPAEVLPPDVQEFLNQLSDVDREEIYGSMLARPELSQETIIRAYAKYKQRANPVAPPQGRLW